MLNTIVGIKKELTQTHPASSYNNGCLRAEEMRHSFSNYNNNEFINISDKQRKNINYWIDSIMMA